MREADRLPIVRIYKKDGSVAGAGVLVSQNHVLTCTHVVANVLHGLTGELLFNASLEEGEGPIHFDCVMLTGKRPFRKDAKVVKSNPVQNLTRPIEDRDPHADLTLLRFDEPLTEIKPAHFLVHDDPEPLRGDEFDVFGFPFGQPESISGIGDIGTANAAMVQLTSKPGKTFPEQGFSGGAVWDVPQAAFVGLVSAVDTTRFAAFMIPARALREFFPQLQSSDAKPKARALDEARASYFVNLCDRQDQDDEIKKYFAGYLKQRPLRPFICVIHGDGNQSVEEYVDRLREIGVPKWLEQKPFHWQPFHWSQDLLDSGREDDIKGRLTSFAQEIGLNGSFDPTPCFISSFLTSNYLGQKDLERQFIRFWQAYQLPIQRPVLVCLAVVYVQPSWFRRLFRAGKEELKERIRAWHSPGDHRIMPPELISVRRDEALEWPQCHELREHGVFVDTREIKSIYDRADAGWPQGGPIAMDLLAPELKDLLTREPA